MNTKKSPIVVIVAFFGILPVALYLTVQFWLQAIGFPLIKIGGESWNIIEWAVRILPWVMALFAYPFALWTEPTLARRWFSFIVLAALNVLFYFSAWPGFSFLTAVGQAWTWAFISLIDFIATFLFVFKQ